MKNRLLFKTKPPFNITLFMDKRNTIIGICLLGLAFLLMFWQGKRTQDQVVQAPQSAQVTSQVAANTESRSVIGGHQPINFFEHMVHPQKDDGYPSLVVNAKHSLNLQTPTNQSSAPAYYTLQNNFIAVTFTNLGGSIEEVALKKYPYKQGKEEPFIFNFKSDVRALAISTIDSMHGYQEFDPAFRFVSQTDNTIIFEFKSPEGLILQRSYTIAKDSNEEQDPYVILHQTKLINNSDTTLALKDIYVSLGTVPPISNDPTGEFLNFGYYGGRKGGSDEFISIKEFKGSSGFLGIGKHQPVTYVLREVPNLVWGSIKNQFFTVVLTAEELGKQVFVTTYPYKLKSKEGELYNEEGIFGAIEYQLGNIEPNQESTYSAQFYAGPKEYRRLEKLGKHQELIMQFGFFSFISKFLLVMMIGIHSLIPNYGVAIILVTIIIKLILWPLTAAATRSSKRMAKIQEPLKALRERYKDNPQKLQHETMRLFKENKVNPAAGCLPILVQIPIFLALFWMLRSASELRFANFLWIKDLSMPDTVAYIAGFPINVLPLIMGVTMVLQMKLTPTPSTDQLQAKIFQLMPFIFLVICYNFPSGLVLYWTVQNILTIIQQYITNRSTDNDPKLGNDKLGKNKLSKGKGKA